MQRYDARTVLAASILAFDINQSVVKESRFKGDANSDTGLQEVTANKILIRQYLNNTDQITNELLTRADALIGDIQQAFIMQTLISTHGTSDFMITMNNIVTRSEITERELGLAAWVPKFAADIEQKQKVRSEMSLYESNSKFIGITNKQIAVDFTLINQQYFAKKDRHFIIGRDHNNNLIAYWTSNSKKIVNSGKLTGHVKRHYTNATQAKITLLNYVKIL